MLKGLLFSPGRISGGFGNLLFFAVRLALGLMMAFGHGLGKFPPSENFITGVAALGFPLPIVFAWCAVLSEFLGGIFIAMGLMTRVSALFLSLTMAAAAFLHHVSDPFERKELALVYLVAFLAVGAIGPGKLSLDHLISKS